jgi:hypothetical protein
MLQKIAKTIESEFKGAAQVAIRQGENLGLRVGVWGRS